MTHLMRPPAQPPVTARAATDTPLPTTRPEMEFEASKRRVLHRRTDRLERMLDDYRAQDKAMR